MRLMGVAIVWLWDMSVRWDGMTARRAYTSGDDIFEASIEG